MEALAIQRRAPSCDEVQLAETMIALAEAKSVKTGIHSAIGLLEEALAILRARHPEANSILLNAQKRLGVLTTIARMQIEDDS